jgi:hypothetical protein
MQPESGAVLFERAFCRKTYAGTRSAEGRLPSEILQDVFSRAYSDRKNNNMNTTYPLGRTKNKKLVHKKRNMRDGIRYFAIVAARFMNLTWLVLAASTTLLFSQC